MRWFSCGSFSDLGLPDSSDDSFLYLFFLHIRFVCGSFSLPVLKLGLGASGGWFGGNFHLFLKLLVVRQAVFWCNILIWLNDLFCLLIICF
jgi:hypothetical protein